MEIIAMKKILLLFALAISGNTFSQKGDAIVQFTNPSAAPVIGGFSNTVEIDLGTCRMIVIAGQTSYDKAGNMVGKDNFEKQAERIFELLKAYIEEAGGKMSDIIKLNTYLVNMSDLGSYVRIRNKYVNTAKPPAATIVQIEKLWQEGLLIETEATVIIPKNK
jgi:2-iminobutanoate/2-iminopropanoate deaminase